VASLLLLLLWAATLQALPQLLHTAQPLAIMQLVVVILTAWCSSTQSMRAEVHMCQVLANLCGWCKRATGSRSWQHWIRICGGTGLVWHQEMLMISLACCSTPNITSLLLLDILADSDTQLHAA
jgi:hypothetical protein